MVESIHCQICGRNLQDVNELFCSDCKLEVQLNTQEENENEG